MTFVVTEAEITEYILGDLSPWDAGYDVEAIVRELDDTYHLTGPSSSPHAARRRMEAIPEDEYRDVLRTYDRNAI